MYFADERNNGTHSVDLVECLPVLFGCVDALRGLDGALHQAGPHAQVGDALVVHVLGERVGVLYTPGRQVPVPADPTLQVHVRLPVLQQQVRGYSAKDRGRWMPF